MKNPLRHKCCLDKQHIEWMKNTYLIGHVSVSLLTSEIPLKHNEIVSWEKFEIMWRQNGFIIKLRVTFLFLVIARFIAIIKIRYYMHYKEGFVKYEFRTRCHNRLCGYHPVTSDIQIIRQWLFYFTLASDSHSFHLRARTVRRFYSSDEKEQQAKWKLLTSEAQIQ